ncbi:MAG: 4-hydroxythreonine-4-phosphate dehydrogenase PdxA [Chloroflexota bacterium]
MSIPIIAISMGDAAGIGPEITIMALSSPEIWEMCRPLVVGEPRVMEAAIRVVGSDLRVRAIAAPAEARLARPWLDVLPPPGLDVGEHVWGRLTPAYGRAAALCLGYAYDLAMAGAVQGVVSAPMNKEALHLGGFDYSDELVYLAHRTHSPDTAMMGYMRGLWTITVAEHVAFRQIADLVTRQRVLDRIHKLHTVLARDGQAQPRIAVAALNVHAGEGGLYGREEIEQIAPAIDDARAQGVAAQGPVPADMVFVRALAGAYDGVVCMYHDQANIARKLQPMAESATIFCGLPAPGGTTAHGTAFDIAGQGIADAGSLRAALRAVTALTAGRR